jgi:hypothetical protein
MHDTSTIKQLKAAAALVIGFGILTAFAALPATAGPTRVLVDLFLWPAAGPHSLATPEARLLCAVSGGLTVGLGVMLWQVAANLYPRDPLLARGLILAGIGSWFVVDSIASVVAGAPFNAVLNVGFLLAFAVPLWLAKPAAPASAAR